MQVIFSTLAESDLEEIGDYIAADNRQRAVTFVQELVKRCQELAATPTAYPARPQLKDGLRARPHGRYIIFYMANPEQVFIVRILHGAQDFEALFKEPES